MSKLKRKKLLAFLLVMMMVYQPLNVSAWEGEKVDAAGQTDSIDDEDGETADIPVKQEEKTDAFTEKPEATDGAKEGTDSVEEDADSVEEDADKMTEDENLYSSPDVFSGDLKIAAVEEEPDNVPVFVYVMDDGWEGNTEKEDQLGLHRKDGNGYYPVGKIEIPQKYVEGQNSPYLPDSISWSELKGYLAGMDTSASLFTAEYASANGNNNMAQYLDRVNLNFGGAGSGKTAFFAWNDEDSFGFSEKGVGYHVDLRLETRTVSYILANPDNLSGIETGKEIGSRGYFENEIIRRPEESSDSYLDISEDYKVTGYYTDAACTEEYTGFGTGITENQRVYVKIEPDVVTTLVYVMDDGWEGNEEKEDQLGLHKKDSNGYYPVGKVEIPRKYVEGKTSPYLPDSISWEELKGYLADMDTSTELFTSEYAPTNGNNHMAQYLDKVNLNFGDRGSGQTAFFDWKWASFGFAEDVGYHIDLRLETRTVKYVLANPENIPGVEAGKEVGSRGYFEYEIIKTPTDSKDWYLELPDGCAVDGYYTDPECTEEYKGFGTEIKEDVTVYVKVIAKTYTVTWLDEDGEELRKDENVRYGTMPSYGSELTKEATDTQYFTFEGWTPSIVRVVDDATYQAVFQAHDKHRVQVKANSLETVYDGTKKHVSGFEGEMKDKGIPVTADGETYYVKGLESEAEGTDVDDSVKQIEIKGKWQVVDENGKDVSERFLVTAIPGNLDIQKRDVILQSADLEKNYDGTALTNADALALGVQVNKNGLYKEEGWAEGEGAEYTFSGSVALSGEIAPNAFVCKLKEATDADNYNIKCMIGTLKIVNRDAVYMVSVRANSLREVYDGTEKKISGFKGETNQGIPVVAANGQTYYVTGLTSEASGTNVADSRTTAISGRAIVKDEAGNDVTGQFQVNVVPGKLTIDKKDVFLKSANLSKEYDGKVLTNADADELQVEVNENGLEKEEGWIGTDGAEYDFTGSVLLVGEVAVNDYRYTFKAGTDGNNYNVRTEKGRLSITNRDARYTVEVTANSLKTVYDGSQKTVSGFVGEETKDGIVRIPVTLKNGIYYVTGLNAAASGTNVSDSKETEVSGRWMVVDERGNDVTAQFQVDVIAGELEIVPAEVTVKAADASKKYDGTALTKEEAEVTDGTLAAGHSFEAIVSGSQTYVGTSDNLLEDVTIYGKTVNGTEVDVTENYIIKKEKGSLTVTDGTENDPVDPNGVVTKTHENKEYGLGDEVIFNIKVKNIYDERKTITLTELPNVVLSQTVFENIPAGGEVTVKASYRITAADVEKGEFTNTITAAFSGGKTFQNTDVVKIKKEQQTVVGTNNKSEGNTISTVKSVKTGDEANLFTYVVLLFASAVVFITLIGKRRRTEK